ncbi:MAG: TlpA family protein disulfide reductase [Marinicellaceae bacterium]
MNAFKTITLLFLFISICFAETEFNQNQWVDIDSIEIRRDVSIQYVNRVGEIIPAVTLIEIKDGRLAVVLSLQAPEYFYRDQEWMEDFQVTYSVKEVNGGESRRIAGELDGFSFDTPNNKWIASLTFLPSAHIMKKDVEKIFIQAKKTPERIAILNQREDERVAREKERDEMLADVPFSNNVIGETFDFELDKHDGTVFNSKKHRGKVLLLDFWSWKCAPCRTALPELQTLIKSYPKSKFEIIGINFDDYMNIDQILSEQGINWQQWVVKQEAMQSAVFKKLNFKGIPYYMIIDQSGKLVKQGYSDEMDLPTDVEKIIAK